MKEKLSVLMEDAPPHIRQAVMVGATHNPNMTGQGNKAWREVSRFVSFLRPFEAIPPWDKRGTGKNNREEKEAEKTRTKELVIMHQEEVYSVLSPWGVVIAPRSISTRFLALLSSAYTSLRLRAFACVCIQLYINYRVFP